MSIHKPLRSLTAENFRQLLRKRFSRNELDGKKFDEFSYKCNGKQTNDYT
ncbi:MAG: hypothetical protein AAFO07_32705 [Bacteroidota bacterium]